jgi:hypothetical protein
VTEWLPHVSEDRLQLLRSHLNFADYKLMKTLLSHRQGYLLFRNIPEVWTDPGLAQFSRNYWRQKQNSSDLSWMAREFADKLATPAPVAGPPKPGRILIVTSQNQTNQTIVSPQPATVSTNASVLVRH